MGEDKLRTIPEIFQWILGLNETAFKLLINSYNADLLSSRYALVLEAIEAMADD